MELSYTTEQAKKVTMILVFFPLAAPWRAKENELGKFSF